MAPGPGEITELLHRLNGGDKSVADRVLELLYDELRQLANSHMRRERIDHTLQPTALVNEFWMRLVDQKEWSLENRAHFFGVASQVMRRILIDHARASNAEKRGRGYVVVSLENALAMAVEHPAQLLDVHRALERLEALDPCRAQLAEMRFFAGLSLQEIADLKGVTSRTVERQWRVARAWLAHELGPGLESNARA